MLLIEAGHGVWGWRGDGCPMSLYPACGMRSSGRVEVQWRNCKLYILHQLFRFLEPLNRRSHMQALQAARPLFTVPIMCVGVWSGSGKPIIGHSLRGCTARRARIMVVRVCDLRKLVHRKDDAELCGCDPGRRATPSHWKRRRRGVVATFLCSCLRRYLEENKRGLGPVPRHVT